MGNQMSTGDVQVTTLLEALLHGQEQLREHIAAIEDALREQRAAYLSISHAARLAELSYDHVRRAAHVHEEHGRVGGDAKRVAAELPGRDQ